MLDCAAIVRDRRVKLFRLRAPSMSTRRNFLRSSAALASFTISGLARMAVADRRERPIGVQLYSVRDQVQTDLNDTLAEIRKIGYKQVETFPPQYVAPAADLRRAILDHGLTVPSGHFGYVRIASQWDYAQELWVKDVVCAGLPNAMRGSLEGIQKAADQFNQWGAHARQLGLRFAFHNHNFEFQQFSATTGLETLLQRTDPSLVFWQMDCYWVAQAGHDPVELMKRHAGRISSLYLEDLKPGFPPTFVQGPDSAHFTEVGSGTVHWKSIFDLATQQKIAYMFVERDSGDLPVMESLRISYHNIAKLLD